MNIHYKAETGAITGYALVGSVDENPTIEVELLPNDYDNRFYLVINEQLIRKDEELIYEIKMSDCLTYRESAYKVESDPLYDKAIKEAEFDGVEPCFDEWRAKVSEIKERYPKPE